MGGGIAKKTKRSDLDKHFKACGATLSLYKGFIKAPFAFVKISNEKVEELLAKKHEVKGATLELSIAKPKVETIRYFLDSRMTKGTFSELEENKVKEYFSQFGEVVKLN